MKKVGIERFKDWKDMSDEREKLEIRSCKESDFINGYISEAVKYHLDNKRPITENIFRAGSEAFFDLINEVRYLYESNKIELLEVDKAIFETTDLGKTAKYNGKLVQLDLPQFTEEYIKESAEYKGKKVELNKPMRDSGGSKPYKVYVRNPDTGNVMVVRFGSGMRAKINDPEARKRYDSRHGCSAGKHNDKTKPGFWSCRLPRYAKMLGLAETSALWW